MSYDKKHLQNIENPVLLKYVPYFVSQSIQIIKKERNNGH